MTTIYRENTARLSISDAKRLILDAVPLEKAYNVYAREDDEGNIEWEGEIKVVLEEKANIQATHLHNDFLATCVALNISPRNKYRPVLQDYSGNVLQDVIYTIAHDEFVRLADSFGLLVELGNAPEPQAMTPSPAPVAKTIAKRRTWRDVSSVYIVEVMRTGQYATAKELYRALEAKTGPATPFDKGTGANRGSLFVREISHALSLKTVQNEWQKLLIAAANK